MFNPRSAFSFSARDPETTRKTALLTESTYHCQRQKANVKFRKKGVHIFTCRSTVTTSPRLFSFCRQAQILKFFTNMQLKLLL